MDDVQGRRASGRNGRERLRERGVLTVPVMASDGRLVSLLYRGGAERLVEEVSGWSGGGGGWVSLPRRGVLRTEEFPNAVFVAVLSPHLETQLFRAHSVNLIES